MYNKSNLLLSFLGASLCIIIVLVNFDSFLSTTSTPGLVNYESTLTNTSEARNDRPGNVVVNKGLSSNVTAQSNEPRHHEVLAFGDSLTAGTSLTSEGYKLFPYAPYLESAINEIRTTNSIGNDKNVSSVVVHHRGLPGWTAWKMLMDLDSEQNGLQASIEAISDPPLSVVILLVGTNDLGHRYGVEEITSDILKLHQICFDNGVPHTIAVSIPSSAYQHRSDEAAERAKTVNENLEKFCTESKTSHCTYFPFPFPYEEKGDYWSIDGLHLSELGYKKFGFSLAPILNQVLTSMEK